MKGASQQYRCIAGGVPVMLGSFLFNFLLIKTQHRKKFCRNHNMDSLGDIQKN